MDEAVTRVGLNGGSNYGAQIGTSHGTVNNSFYLPNATTLPPPAPCNTVPFRRDLDFVDAGILSDIFDRAAAPASRVALVGLGGVGKSQLAIEYAHRVSESQPHKWVFWVHASTPERFKDSYQRIAERLQLPECNGPGTDFLNGVYLWLSNTHNGQWVMIVDNADDERVLFRVDSAETQPQQLEPFRSRPLSEYLPQSSNGSVLVTTRSRQVAFRLTGRDQDIVGVEPMGSVVAVTLLQKKLRDSSDHEGMLQLGEEVGYMPLALTQAAAYINQRSPGITIRHYIERLRRCNRDQLQLLQTDLGDPRRDGAASNSIILTLQITLDHIDQVSPGAASLLAWMSMFDRESIQVEFLDEANFDLGNESADETSSDHSSIAQEPVSPTPTDTPKQHPTTESSDRLVNYIATLRTFDLVHYSASGSTLNMHRLVQLSAQKWIDKLPGRLEQYQIRFISFLFHQFSTDVDKNGSRCRQLFQHIMMLVSIRPTDDKAVRRRTVILLNASTYAQLAGQVEAAESLLRQGLEGMESVAGEVGADIVMEGNLLLDLLRSDKSPNLDVPARSRLEQSWRQFGKSSLTALRCASSLVSILRHRKHDDAAEELCEQALAQCKDLSRYPDPNDLDHVLRYRGKLLCELGRWDQAIEAYQQSMTTIEMYSARASDVVDAMDGLARCYRGKRDYRQAQELQESVLTVETDRLGIDHPGIMGRVRSLANTLCDGEKVDEAERLCREALQSRQQNLEDNIITYESMCILAEILTIREKWEEAREWYEQGLQGVSGYATYNVEAVRLWREGYALLLERLKLSQEHSDLLQKQSELSQERLETEERLRATQERSCVIEQSPSQYQDHIPSSEGFRTHTELSDAEGQKPKRKQENE